MNQNGRRDVTTRKSCLVWQHVPVVCFCGSVGSRSSWAIFCRISVNKTSTPRSGWTLSASLGSTFLETKARGSAALVTMANCGKALRHNSALITALLKLAHHSPAEFCVCVFRPWCARLRLNHTRSTLSEARSQASRRRVHVQKRRVIWSRNTVTRNARLGFEADILYAGVMVAEVHRITKWVDLWYSFDLYAFLTPPSLFSAIKSFFPARRNSCDQKIVKFVDNIFTCISVPFVSLFWWRERREYQFKFQFSKEMGRNMDQSWGGSFKFPLQPHQKYHLTFHSLLRWKIIKVAILTTSLIHSYLNGWENVVFELGSEKVKESWKIGHYHNEGKLAPNRYRKGAQIVRLLSSSSSSLLLSVIFLVPLLWRLFLVDWSRYIGQTWRSWVWLNLSQTIVTRRYLTEKQG